MNPLGLGSSPNQAQVESGTELNILHSSLGPLLVGPANAKELGSVIGIMDEAACWLESKGIHQWPSPQPPAMWEVMMRHIDKGGVYLFRRQSDDLPVGTITFEWEPNGLWPRDQRSAGYLYWMAIRNRVRGAQVGTAILDWAREYIRHRGREFVRFDCWAENPQLCQYYERNGFRHCGMARSGSRVAALYEKRSDEAFRIGG